VLLPGVTTLARLVARERDAATLRVWTELAQPVSGRQARLLRGLLVVPEGSRRSELDRMRKAETVTSGAGMVRAPRRSSRLAGGGAWCTARVARRAPWTRRRTCSACWSSFTVICCGATSTRPRRRVEAIRARSCSRDRHGTLPGVRRSMRSGYPRTPTSCSPSIPGSSTALGRRCRGRARRRLGGPRRRGRAAACRQDRRDRGPAEPRRSATYGRKYAMRPKMKA
jgi:hypothetical protein